MSDRITPHRTPSVRGDELRRAAGGTGRLDEKGMGRARLRFVGHVGDRAADDLDGLLLQLPGPGYSVADCLFERMPALNDISPHLTNLTRVGAAIRVVFISDGGALETKMGGSFRSASGGLVYRGPGLRSGS